MSRSPSTAEQLERLTEELHSLVFDVREARHAGDYDECEERGRRISADIVKAFRG